MKKKSVRRENPYAFSKLDLLYNIKVQFIIRDKPVLEKYRIQQFDETELKEISQELKDAIKDSEMILKQKDITGEKDELIAELLINLNFLHTVMRNSVGRNELKNLIPSIFKLSTQTDAQLAQSADAALRVALIYKNVLENWGVTDEFLNKLRTLTEKCEIKLFEAGSCKSVRNQTTLARNETANKAYRTLLQMCNVGRMIWSFEKDIAKYNDYILPPAKKTKPKKAEQISAQGLEEE